MANIVIRTEKWGNTIKAVARNEKGQFLGCTNQTTAIKFLEPMIVGKK